MTCLVRFPASATPTHPALITSWGPSWWSFTPEVAAAFWWPGPQPSRILFHCSVAQSRSSITLRSGGRAGGEGALWATAGGGWKPPRRGRALLKGNCEKSRADSGCLAVSWQQAWQEVFLSLHPHLPSLLHHPALFLYPLCLVLCIIKTSLQPFAANNRALLGPVPLGALRQPALGVGAPGVRPPEMRLCVLEPRLKLNLATFGMFMRAAHWGHPHPGTSSFSHPLPPSLSQVPHLSYQRLKPANTATGHCPTLPEPHRAGHQWPLT